MLAFRINQISFEPEAKSLWINKKLLLECLVIQNRNKAHFTNFSFLSFFHLHFLCQHAVPERKFWTSSAIYVLKSIQSTSESHFFQFAPNILYGKGRLSSPRSFTKWGAVWSRLQFVHHVWIIWHTFSASLENIRGKVRSQVK